ncbi:peroxidase, putative (macronuclear) [Tetrahymena thermophila SB210]|uniref:Peroxidase, putative n=1 Tax=Tetrahymena thermophila (strain SB210) TaxID=312017 RepID=Q22P05_TETTS|nr:peroxidase, putative [Tetrahymena thermophila SB210]EAR87006.1 peroxidase, putative [Tetrahymena thermophila SB210]|eukprot:XP_001007251.1 peroxidase, putative [Tetrahymena thermophila SB210]
MIKITFLLCLITFAFASDFTSLKYQSQKRSSKLNQIWGEVTKNTSSAKFPSPVGLLLESMSPTLDHVADQLPEGRSKKVHSVGSVAKAEFIAEKNFYTGFFQGADSLIIRFSLAKEPDYTHKQSIDAHDNFVPGIALKFLIDGQPSANLFAMHGVNGVYSYNFFDLDFNNHIPQPEGLQLKVVADKFSTGTKIVQFLGLRKFSEHTQDGKPVPNPNFPYMLTFKPYQYVKDFFTPDYTEDYKEILKKIPSGTLLFEVYATLSPTQTCKQKIGDIRTTSEITPSYFGDTELFFQHQDFTHDLEVHPEWEPYTPYWNLIGNKSAKQKESKCPFSNLFI